MEVSQGSSNSPPPFLVKTYDMVDDPSTDNIVSWSRTLTSFIVWNPPEFSRDLLPKYFKHNNFSSFVRQLNTYGFRKVDPDQWEFANEDFIRGQRHLLKNIHRRKPIHSHSLHNSSAPLAEAERLELQEEIDKLKHEKVSLISELQRHTQQQLGMERQMQSLEERLQNVENRQRSMMNFLAQILQRPGFLSNIVQHSDLQNKKRRLPKTNYFYDDADMEENQIVSFQPSGREKSDVSSVQLLDLEPFERMESTLISLENFFRDVSQACGEGLYIDSDVPCLPSPVALTEMHASSGETGVNFCSSSPKVHSSSPCLRDIHSSPELAESTSYAESPALPLTDIQIDTRSKVSEIDVNSEPVVPENDLSKDRAAGNAPSTVPTGVNDVFWQQFLTETPGCSDTQEVQSERRDADDRSEGRTGERGNISWNRKNVDHLTEKMGHLTSV